MKKLIKNSTVIVMLFFLSGCSAEKNKNLLSSSVVGGAFSTTYSGLLISYMSLKKDFDFDKNSESYIAHLEETQHYRYLGFLRREEFKPAENQAEANAILVEASISAKEAAKTFSPDTVFVLIEPLSLGRYNAAAGAFPIIDPPVGTADVTWTHQARIKDDPLRQIGVRLRFDNMMKFVTVDADTAESFVGRYPNRNATAVIQYRLTGADDLLFKDSGRIPFLFADVIRVDVRSSSEYGTLLGTITR